MSTTLDKVRTRSSRERLAPDLAFKPTEAQSRWIIKEAKRLKIKRTEFLRRIVQVVMEEA